MENHCRLNGCDFYKELTSLVANKQTIIRYEHERKNYGN